VVRAGELADEVSSGCARTLNWVGWCLADMSRHAPFTEALAEAMKDWTETNDNVKALREALHEGA
jgi:hypothetical protein